MAAGTGKYYLIVDAYSGSGDFTITGYNGGGPSSVEQSTWGGIKGVFK